MCLHSESFAVTMFGFGVFVIERWDTELPVWAFVLALIICAASLIIIFPLQLTSLRQALVYTIPIGVIQAITNFQAPLKVTRPYSTACSRLQLRVHA
jgi:cytochrome c oxidase subunit IV